MKIRLQNHQRNYSMPLTTYQNCTRWAMKLRTGVLRCGLAALIVAGTTYPAFAQVEAENKAPVVQSVSPEEFERFLGGIPNITIQAKDVPIEDVLAQLNQQAKLKLQFETRYRPLDLKKTITFEVTDMPLWDAVRELENQSHGQIKLFENDLGLHGLAPNDYAKEYLSPQSIRGPMYFLNPRWVTRETKATRTFADDETKKQETFALNGDLMFDPRFHAIAGSSTRVTEAIDDKGNSLLGDAKELVGSSSNMVAPNYVVFKANLKSTPEMGKSIASLKGVVSTLFSVKSETWEIDDAPNAAGATKTFHTNIGDVTYTLNTTKAGGNLLFVFEINGPTPAVIDGQSAPFLSKIAMAYDANGKIMPINGYGYSGGENMQRNAHLDFPTNTPEGIPRKIVLNVPLDYYNLDIPFEFKDLPLPPAEPTPPTTTAPAKPVETAYLTLDEAMLRTGGTPLVTLKFKTTNAAEVVAELARQSAINVAFSQDPNRLATIPAISIDVEQQPFWTAMRAILAACKLRFGYEMHGQSVELVAINAGDGIGQWQAPIGAAGHARITAFRVNREHNSQINYAPLQSSVTNALRFTCLVALPPQLAGLPFTGSIRVDEALDDKGNATPPIDNMASGPSHLTGEMNYEQDIVLRPKAESRWLSLLKGTIRLDMATRRELWEIPDALNVKEATHKVNVTYGDKTFEQTYKVSEVAVTPDEYKFTMNITTEPAQPEWRENNGNMRAMAIPWYFRNHTHLRDLDGKVFPIVDLRIMSNKADGPIVIRIPRRVHAHTLGAPDKLVLELPTDIQPVAIPFEFKDIPLP